MSGSPFDLRPALDENGAPIFGPDFLPQLFSTDPGRAAITGAPAHFEAFDIPPLRGIKNSAPYFHDNTAETLRDLVDIYSRFRMWVPSDEMVKRRPTVGRVRITPRASICGLD